MKKTLALILAAVMALSLVACAKTPANGGTETKGSVYYLNFKPEADQAWQALAKTYTEKTGVEVKVVTAASGQYDTMLTSELDKSAPPTMFQVGNQGAVNSYGDFCYPLDNTDVMKEMTTQDFNLKNANGETVSIGYCYEAFGIIVNKALLKQAGYEITDITNFETLKKVADDIHSRAAELGFGSLFTVVVTNKIARSHADNSNDQGHDHSDRGHCVHSPLFQFNAKLKAGDAAQQDTGNDIERAFNAKSDTKTIRTTQNRRHGQKHTAFLFTVPFYIKQARFA